ncbi:hypothetical protein [Methylomonas methanica]|uniref:hypothetical protein n=1 Tax=Methylomonas methanica TaxID=421 RepID=UPI0012F6226E|nr:hypothetical protein [Methylomonas methanica]
MRPVSLLLAAVVVMGLSSCATVPETTLPAPATWSGDHAANSSLLGKIKCRASLYSVLC